MSELKEVKFHEMNAIKLGLRNDKLYFKSESDKVIAELKDKLQKESGLVMETRELLLESQKMHKRCADNAVKIIRHNKYKRCLAMANFCFTKSLFLRYVLADRIQN